MFENRAFKMAHRDLTFVIRQASALAHKSTCPQETARLDKP